MITHQENQLILKKSFFLRSIWKSICYTKNFHKSKNGRQKIDRHGVNKEKIGEDEETKIKKYKKKGKIQQ